MPKTEVGVKLQAFWGSIIFFSILLSLLGAWAVRTALAECAVARLTAVDTDQARVAAYQRAIRMRPDVADYYRKLGVELLFDHPDSALDQEKHAVALNSYDWKNWRRLALAEFRLGDDSSAKHAFSEALRYDSGFESHFQLANFALLQGDLETFDEQQRSALAVVDPSQAGFVFQSVLSAHRGTGGALVHLLPARRPYIQLEAVHYLADRGQPRAALAAWKTASCPVYLQQQCSQTARSLVASLITTALADSNDADRSQFVRSAELVWNEAISRGSLPPLPATPGRINDPNINGPMIGPAFAWAAMQQQVPLQPIADPAAPNGSALSIGFDGFEPEQDEILKQIVPVQGAVTYHISFRCRSDEDNTPRGLSLAVVDDHGNELVTLPATCRHGWTQTQAVFTTSSQNSLITAEFRYGRPQGEVRIPSPVFIAGVKMIPVH